MENRCTAFRLLSNTICGVLYLFVDPHSKLPVSMFKFLDSTHSVTAASIRDAPRCMQDRWPREQTKKYAPDFNSKRFRSVLIVVALLITLDTVQLETRHASNRRPLVQRSLQTHLSSLEDVSLEFVMQRIRRNGMKFVYSRKQFLTLVQLEQPARGAFAEKGTRKREREPPEGGGQRAYVSEQFKKRRLRFRNPQAVAMLND